MKTIEEYQRYTRQLEGEVGKWHHAYDALMVERNQLAGKYAEINLRAAAMAQRIAELETEIEGLKRSEKQAKELADPYTQFCEARADVLEKALADYHWRKCRDEMPEEWACVIVYLPDGNYRMGMWSKANGWDIDGLYYKNDEIVAWHPFPMPPEE